MEEADVLNEFENAKAEKSQDWFGVIICLLLCAMLSYFAYLYYKMYFINENTERLQTAFVYTFAAGFQFSAAIFKIIIRYRFIQKESK